MKKEVVTEKNPTEYKLTFYFHTVLRDPDTGAFLGHPTLTQDILLPEIPPKDSILTIWKQQYIVGVPEYIKDGSSVVVKREIVALAFFRSSNEHVISPKELETYLSQGWRLR